MAGSAKAQRIKMPLPTNIPKRGLKLGEAAEYCGLPLSTFYASVAEGLLPGPIFPGRCRVWDRLALDRAMNALSGIAEASSDAAEEAALKAIRHGGGKRALRR
jgi:hypothetical protein